MRDYSEEHGDWVRIAAIVDSGAYAPIAPPDVLPELPILPNEASRTGRSFNAASGNEIM